MRRAICGRALRAAAMAGALCACSNGSPTTPEVPGVAVATGPQVLRVTSGAPCTEDGRPVLVLLYTRVTVARSGDGWTASATSPESGTVELRFQQTRPVVTSMMPVSGIIRGFAVHVPDLVPGPPMTKARVDFGSDARIDGFAFAPSALTSVAGVSGIGSGTVTVTDSDGRSCQASTFSWGLGPQS